MAEPARSAKQFEFEMAQTVIRLFASRLNDAGRKVATDYVATLRKEDAKAELPTMSKNGKEVPILPVGVNFPYPKGGIEQYIEPAFLASWKATWKEQVLGRGIKVDLDLDKFIQGQARIDLNRDRTPVAEARFYETTTDAKGGTKAAPKTKNVGAAL